MPLIIFAIPIYLMFQLVGLLDTWTGMILIDCIINIPWRSCSSSASSRTSRRRWTPRPRSTARRAGECSGTSSLPLSRPIVFAVAILSFIYGWNEFLFGLILTTKQAVPVTVGATFFVTSYGVKWGATAAAMTFGIIPPLILGLFAYPVYRQVDDDRRGEGLSPRGAQHLCQSSRAGARPYPSHARSGWEAKAGRSAG